MNNPVINYIFKGIIIGDSNTGKSTITNVAIKNETRNVATYDPTIGIEFGSRVVELRPNLKIKLYLWDTAGQEAFRSIIRSYYRNISWVFLTYDVTRYRTFQNLYYWISELHKYNNCKNHIHPIILIGTKIDKEGFRSVTTEEGQQFADENNMGFIETNALYSEGMEKIIIDLTNNVYNNLIDNGRDDNMLCSGIKLQSREKRHLSNGVGGGVGEDAFNVSLINEDVQTKKPCCD